MAVRVAVSQWAVSLLSLRAARSVESVGRESWAGSLWAVAPAAAV